MSGKRVAVISPDGQFGTISEEHAEAVVKAGGRRLSKEEGDKRIAEVAMQERYDALPTSRKVSGALSVVPSLVAGPLGLGGISHDAPPTLAALGSGVRSGLTAGLSDLAEKKGIETIGGKDKATQYVQLRDDEQTASPVAHGVGEAVGMVGGSLIGGTGAARALPSAGISALGSAAERGVGRALSGLATRGVGGRALAAAAGMGAQGAVEGGLYAGAQYATEQALHDKELAADKLFAAAGTGALYGGLAGGALGGGASLLASGVDAAKGGLARMLTRSEPAAVSAEGGAYRTAAQRADLPRPSSGISVDDFLRAPKDAGRRLSNEFAFDALGATKTQARNALENVVGGAEAVGEYVNRVGIAPATEKAGFLGGMMKAGAAGRADDLLAAIQADKYGRVASGLSSAVKGTPARVDMRKVMQKNADLYESMLKDPTKAAGADAFFNRLNDEITALERSGKVNLADGTMDAAEAFYLRSGLAKQAYEVRKINGAAGDAYKQFLRNLDDETIGAMDKAAASAGKSSVADDIRHWKREWQLASAAEEAAQGGAERMTRNNTFGIRESIGAAVGLATGSTLGAAGTMLGGKMLRERGSAMAAYAMSQAAERDILTRWLQKIDDQIGKASKGLLQAPAKGLLKPADKMPAAKVIARTAVNRVAEYQADPDAFVDRATKQAESITTHDPELADAIVQRQVKAMSFLASKLPVTPDPDPMDPHPAPKMTPNEEAEFGRYAWYAEKPARFFAEVSRGKITFEGAETAQALMPRAFAALQEQTQEHIATMMSRGDKIPFRQRQYIGVLLDMAATPSQRPDHARFLQANVSQDAPPPPPPKKALMDAPKSHMSALDRLELGAAGRS